jgi:undecaprenyl-diphosphatase
MTILHSILLGIVQGLTEFIPVSSTAHLLLGQYLLGLEASSELFSFTVLVQLGTLLSLIVFYWKDLYTIIVAWLMDVWHGIIMRHKPPFQDPQARLGWYLIIGSIPAAVAGVLLKSLIEELFNKPLVEASIRMLITISLLLAAEYWGKRNRKMEDIRWADALWIGSAQVLSVFPGASRSGSTIAGGMLRGLDRPAAARFAFLLSVPIMTAAGAYETFDLLRSDQVPSSFLPSILIGILTAAIVGYLAIRWLLGYLARRPLSIFAIYCAIVLLGIALLLVF